MTSSWYCSCTDGYGQTVSYNITDDVQIDMPGIGDTLDAEIFFSSAFHPLKYRCLRRQQGLRDAELLQGGVRGGRSGLAWRWYNRVLGGRQRIVGGGSSAPSGRRRGCGFGDSFL